MPRLHVELTPPKHQQPGLASLETRARPQLILNADRPDNKNPEIHQVDNPSISHPSHLNPEHATSPKLSSSRISRTRRANLGRSKRQIKQIPNQPQNIQNTQHPQRSHEFISRRAPCDAPDKTATIGTFDGPATRRRGWHLTVC